MKIKTLIQKAHLYAALHPNGWDSLEFLCEERCRYYEQCKGSKKNKRNFEKYLYEHGDNEYCLAWLIKKKD